MEVKLNLIERALIELGNALFHAAIKVNNVVYRRYDRDLEYHSRSYYRRTGVLVFWKNEEERKEMES